VRAHRELLRSPDRAPVAVLASDAETPGLDTATERVVNFVKPINQTVSSIGL